MTPSKGPWETARPLTLATARRVVASAFPEMEADSLEPLGSGWEFDVFRTTDGWAVRFPRRSEAESLFARERPILELVRPALPPSVAVPRVEVRGHEVADFPYRVAAHRFLDGVPADRVAGALRPTLAESLGDALSAIHSVPVAGARAAGLAELDRGEPGRIEWLSRGTAGVRALDDQGALPHGAGAWLAEIDDPLRRLDAPVRLIHHDLSPEHLLADPRSGRLTGILDWTDSILGDPARDFVPLVTMGGWRLVDDVLARYPLGPDPGFHDRLRFMARLLPLMRLGHAFLEDEDVGRHLGWVRNAFEE